MVKFDIARAPGWGGSPRGAWGMSSRFPRVALQAEDQAFSQASQGWLPSLSRWLDRPVWLRHSEAQAPRRNPGTPQELPSLGLRGLRRSQGLTDSMQLTERS